MAERVFHKSILRNEDPQILAGKAQYLDDIELPGLLYAAFKRSDYAHARLKSIDVSEARALPGVIGVYTAEDFGDLVKPGPLQVPPPTAIKGATYSSRTLMPIAKDKVRYSGEPVAVVIAESRYIAEDACDYIYPDYEPLEAVIDLEKALQPGATLVHEDLPSNEAAHVVQERGNYAEAAKKADVIIKKKIYVDRVAAAALENRGIVINWDEKAQMMTIWCGTQSPITLRNATASRMGLFENQVRVITPFTGGGFGPKINTSMPDDVLLTELAVRLNRPIKWYEDRRENFLATTSERDQVHYAEIALTKEGKFLGFKDVFYHNSGAYDPYMMTVPLNTQTHTVSNYNIPNFYTEITMVFSNEMVVTPVRGAGRPQGVFVMERMIDAAARELKMDVAEIRRINLIQPDAYPVSTGIIGQDFVEGVLDSGDYPTALAKAMSMIDYKKFREEIQPKARAEGKHLGIGICTFTEGTGVGPYEGAKITVGGNGKVSVATGVATQGQAHYTTFAQIAAEQLGVEVKDVKVVTGDTGAFAWGAGTFASRGATVAGTAIHLAAVKVKDKALKLASKILETPESELELVGGYIQVADIPGKKISLGELASMANPMRGTFPPGAEPGLEAVAYYGPPYGATGAGCMAMILDVDAETMKPKIERLVMVHDCGIPINPMVVEGQVHGGIQMGIGNAFFEKVFYDETGQLLTASFMDYLFPQATDMPPKIEMGHTEIPSPLNPLGIKGVGEAGAIPTPAVFTQALEDALYDTGVEIMESNLSPSKVYSYVMKAKGA
ncbi:MAG: xanthine dehydrogenase family protein molybdopterin-binding subunit [Chloroflexi bacterium]|nr:MAG: xanthine dehydrogenase family protein molybdopterin-binding subunit [Chloroflexota bacterium]